MLEVHCSGTPYEIGFQHGSMAAAHVAACIRFYDAQFQKKTKLHWNGVRKIAMQFEPTIRQKWPLFLEEMQGIAAGAKRELSDIIALNVRTEIRFGLFNDGCTALSWLTSAHSYLAQNWDWMLEQKPNLILLHITQAGKPTIKMVTEAGIIGKIGLNSAGVGVCLNAVQAYGMDPTRMPVHLGLRSVLESSSRTEAVSRLQEHGIASSCHILIADATGSVGVECSARDMLFLPMDSSGRVFHSNHFLLTHPGVVDTVYLPDSIGRIKRIRDLVDDFCTSGDGDRVTEDAIFNLFKDEQEYPTSINRDQVGVSDSASLFNIMMDLRGPVARVTLGRPTVPEEQFYLSF